ncbi:MAG: ADP-ribosylglycohydrolase [Gracilibacter sp. BRH_c7a]|nr:MAG: ADP-ribosylglycohydrolase [Gracilibacter sp. BRH_c7a]
MEALLARTRGALIGVGIGDALGATLEFMTKDEIKYKYGLHTELTGGGYWDLALGEVTDDTAMTIAVARGIISMPEDPVLSIANNFTAWAKSKPKDIGNICKLVLEEGHRRGTCSEAEWLEIAETAHFWSGKRSAGNGSLMRTIPIVLGYFRDRDLMLSLAQRVSALTHFDSIVEKCIRYYCDLVRTVLLEGNLHSVLLQAEQDAPFELDLTTPSDQLNTSGYVVHTLQTALTCVYQTNSFESALTKVVNLGGDADTIGAVTGGLAGAYYGDYGIPSRWLENLVVKDELRELAGNLYKIDYPS